MSRIAGFVAVALALLQAGLWYNATVRARARHVTYVFTPLVDVVPGGVPLSAVEASDLAAGARNQVDARDIQRAFARMGSNISLNDLLEGVESLEGTEEALDAGQRQRVASILTKAKADHDAVVAVQDEILRDEAEIGRDVDEILAALPPDVRERVQARAQADGKRGPQPGGPPQQAPPQGGAQGAGPGAQPGGRP